MKIMITGGAGFVGSHLAEFLLKKNHELTIITRKQTQNLSNIKKNINKFSTKDDQAVIKSLKKDLYPQHALQSPYLKLHQNDF